MIIDNPLISKLANVWLNAEATAKETNLGMPQIAALEHAADRVKLVLQGEVRWSEASPGDKAIWNGRLRETGKFNRWWRSDNRKSAPLNKRATAAEDDLLSLVGDAFLEGRRLEAAQILSELAQLKRMPVVDPLEIPFDPPQNLEPSNQPPPSIRRSPRLHGMRERMWWNFYDTILIGGVGDLRRPPRHAVNGIRMFGNTNVGDPCLTNVQVPGQISGEQTCVIMGFYVASPSLDGLCWSADNVRVQLWIGSRPMTPEVFVRDLVMGIQLPRPLIVPVRQSFSAQVFMPSQPPSLPEFDLTVHLDCLLTRDVA